MIEARPTEPKAHLLSQSFRPSSPIFGSRIALRQERSSEPAPLGIDARLRSAADRNAAEVSCLLDYRRALGFLAHGHVQAGASVLGEVARRSRDDQLRSTCLLTLGEVLEQLHRPVEAYRVWYPLAHKPRNQRSESDLAARCHVIQMFNRAGLRLIPPAFPPRIQVEVTNRCNLNCIMCTRGQMRRPPCDLKLAHLKKIADECSLEAGSGLMLFFLGEPLLHPGLEEMVAYLASVKNRSPLPMGFAMQTNGMLLTPGRARALVDAGLREFYFSLDALEGDLERIRRGASYPVVERNIHYLLRLRRRLHLNDLRVCISKLCDDPHADEVQRFKARWSRLVDRIYLNGITKVAGTAYMTADGAIRQVAGGPGPRRGDYCGQGQRLLVHANGDYAFCHGDINGLFKLGNVQELSVHDAWNSPEINAIRSKVLAAEHADLPACEQCPLINA